MPKVPSAALRREGQVSLEYAEFETQTEQDERVECLERLTDLATEFGGYRRFADAVEACTNIGFLEH